MGPPDAELPTADPAPLGAPDAADDCTQRRCVCVCVCVGVCVCVTDHAASQVYDAK